MSTPATYQPGVRNLDAAEAKQRRDRGLIGLVLLVLGGVALAYFKVGAPWWTLLFFPALLAALGLLQSRARFCVMVAMTSRSPATNDSDRAKDRNRALQMIAQAVVIAVLVAAAAYAVRK